MLNLEEVLQSIDPLAKEGKWTELKDLIVENQLTNSNHVKIINTLANIYVIEGDLEQAEQIIQRGLRKHEFHADVNFNAGCIYYYLNEYKKSLYHYFWFAILQPNEKQVVIPYYTEISKHLTKEDIDNIECTVLSLAQNSYIAFPRRIDNMHKTYPGGAFQIQNESYFVGLYEQTLRSKYEQPNEIPTEIFKAKEQIVYESKFTHKTTLPIMVHENTGNFKICYENEKIQLNALVPKRYQYYSFPENCTVKISDSTPFVMGNPIVHYDSKEKPKLILNIYFDGLSQYFLNQIGFENIMPNSARFFSQGTICEQVYVPTEWTYPSVANVFTGKYTMNHRLFHPKYNPHCLHEQKLFPEVLGQEGYFRTMIESSWRSSPLNGYVKGFDRTLYSHAYFGFNNSNKVIAEVLEQLHAFPDTNQFIQLSLFELHDISENINLSFGAQTQIEAKYHKNIVSNVKSVDEQYDVNKLEKYRVQLLKMDMFLAGLYHYIETHYTENEFLISLTADHGLGFLKDSHYLDNHNIHIPMMFRGKNVPQGKCKELIQSMDLFPIIFQCAFGDAKTLTNLYDANIPKWFGGSTEREYAFAESLYPDKPYRAIFYEDAIKVLFEMQGTVRPDGQIVGKEFQASVYDTRTDKELTASYSDKISYYQEILFNHIQEYRDFSSI